MICATRVLFPAPRNPVMRRHGSLQGKMPPLVNWHRFDGWAVSQVNWLAPRLWSGPGEPFIDAEDCVLIGTKEVYGVVHPPGA
jgi:hypothetical protein